MTPRELPKRIRIVGRIGTAPVIVAWHHPPGGEPELGIEADRPAELVARRRIDGLVELREPVTLPGFGGGRASLSDGPIIAAATIVEALDLATSIEGLELERQPPDTYA